MSADQSPTGTIDCRNDSLGAIRRTLSADRYGKIQAVIVTPSYAEAAEVVIEHCWHDAAVIVEAAA